MFKGNCLCGKVKYEVSESVTAPAYQLICCCTQCQTVGGGFGVGSMIFPKDSVKIVEGAEDVREFVLEGSAKGVIRRFCSHCGTHMMAFGSTHPVIAVHAGTLQSPDAFKPQVVIWGKSKRAYHTFPPGIPIFDEYPPSS